MVHRMLPLVLTLLRISLALSGPTLLVQDAVENVSLSAEEIEDDELAVDLSFPSPIPPSVELGWLDPRNSGGRMLDFATKKYGEPINVIVSGKSDPRILTERGFRHYTHTLGYGTECLGLHFGGPQYADLGDGFGKRPQIWLARQNYFPVWGTCWESMRGGHHFRAWKQNATDAWFLAVSKEQCIGLHHRITRDGYNFGRDWLVERAKEGGMWNGRWWKADVEYKTLLDAGWKGVNHNISQDGLVAILTVYHL